MKQSQNQLILEHLESGLSLTAYQALAKFGCLRLASRIFELREKGYLILAETIELPNDKRISKYYLV